MNTWSIANLAAIDRADEVELATRRTDGTLRPARIVRAVRVGDAIYVRSVNGAGSAWYRGVQSAHAGTVSAGPLTRDVAFVEAGGHAGDDAALDDAVDAAYRTKYRRWSGPVEHITAPKARATTLRLDPA